MINTRKSSTQEKMNQGNYKIHSPKRKGIKDRWPPLDAYIKRLAESKKNSPLRLKIAQRPLYMTKAQVRDNMRKLTMGRALKASRNP